MIKIARIPLKFLAVLAVAGVVGGCAEFTPPPPPESGVAKDMDIISSSYQATERLLGSSQQKLAKDRPILVASLVHVANLELSSNLGRIISEQMSSRLTQLGYLTREMKFRGSFLIREGAGEFVLSRQLQSISKKQNAQAIITGVYAVARTMVMVSVRLIRAEDSTVLASHDFTLPLGPDTLALLDPLAGVEY